MQFLSGPPWMARTYHFPALWSLTPASLTFTVLHVPDIIVSSSIIAPVSKIAGGPREMVVAGYGGRIALPASLSGKKVEVTLFDVQGRLIGRMPAKSAGAIVRHDAAEGIVLAKVRVVK